MRWNNELDCELEKLISKHHNYDEISKIMKCSIRSVQNRAFRLGLKIDLVVETICLNCNKKIKRCRSHIGDKNFCSSSCAATYNNRGRIQSNKTKEKIKNKLIKIKYNENKSKLPKLNFTKIKKCNNCDNLIPIKLKICNDCKIKYYDYYRPLCEFKFNLADYPNEFDFDLIKKYGWYSPTNKNNNLSGISRDHMYCVRDGFNNKINPEIIKHPANCRLMIHDENNKKHNNSSITIGELLEKIKIWNNKYGIK